MQMQTTECTQAFILSVTLSVTLFMFFHDAICISHSETLSMAIDSFGDQSLLDIKLNISIVSDVVGLINEIWYEFLRRLLLHIRLANGLNTSASTARLSGASE